MNQAKRGELMLLAILSAEAGKQATALEHINELCSLVDAEARADERAKPRDLVEPVQK